MFPRMCRHNTELGVFECLDDLEIRVMRLKQKHFPENGRVQGLD